MRPFHGGGHNEIVRQPKVYAFATGFVSFARGWDPLCPDDCGTLWEHLVLEQLQAQFPETPACYWRDKAGHEVDFILPHGRDQVDASACKWDPRTFDSAALKLFRSYYPQGRNFLVTPSGDPAYTKRYGDLEVRICTPTELRPATVPIMPSSCLSSNQSFDNFPLRPILLTGCATEQRSAAYPGKHR